MPLLPVSDTSPLPPALGATDEDPQTLFDDPRPNAQADTSDTAFDTASEGEETTPTPEDPPTWYTTWWKAHRAHSKVRLTRACLVLALLAVVVELLVIWSPGGWKGGDGWQAGRDRWLGHVSWWGLWAAWWGVLMLSFAGLGAAMGWPWVQDTVAKQMAHRPAQRFSKPRARAHRPGSYQDRDLVRYTTKDKRLWDPVPWPKARRRWVLGAMLAGMSLGGLGISLMMLLVTGLQAMVAVGLLPALNLHHTWQPAVLSQDGVRAWGCVILWALNLLLPTGLGLIMMGMALDHATDLQRVWEHWTLCSSQALRRGSPAWQAVLNQDWPAVEALTRLDPLAMERRSLQGGSLLTQALLLHAPASTLMHLLVLGLDPQRSWTPWNPDLSLDSWLRATLADDKGQAWTGQRFTPPSTWDSTWKNVSNQIGWSTEDLMVLLSTVEQHALRQSLKDTPRASAPGSTPVGDEHGTRSSPCPAGRTTGATPPEPSPADETSSPLLAFDEPSEVEGLALTIGATVDEVPAPRRRRL